MAKKKPAKKKPAKKQNKRAAPSKAAKPAPRKAAAPAKSAAPAPPVTAAMLSGPPEAFHEIREINRRLFLKAYADRGTIKRAAMIAGVDRTLHYHWLRDDGYKAAFGEAQRMYREKLEEEADRRAVDGVQRLKFFKGELILVPCEPGDPLGRCLGKTATGDEVWAKPYIEHEYSDNLLMFRLKRLDPRYKDRIDVKTKHKTTIKLEPAQAPGGLLEAFRKRLLDNKPCRK